MCRYQILPPPANGGINEPQDCPHCRRTFSCYYSLKRHFQDKHDRSDTLYVCEFCRRRYRTKNSLTTHKSLQHRGSAVALKRLMKTFAATAAETSSATAVVTPSSESPLPKQRSRSPPLVVCNGYRSSSSSPSPSPSSSAPSPSPPPPPPSPTANTV
ncbi:zinc finger protein 692-like [Aphis gossypii]|uniref:zinc finger protein 692-like n=1 Tax=Aphis gossypii TaxID=80765 RepID=UPI002159967A|nr:zinc finger protein 692-like [Aphis gossypii]